MDMDFKLLPLMIHPLIFLKCRASLFTQVSAVLINLN